MSKVNPADFLASVIGKRVVVKLGTGAEYRGTPPARRSPATARRAAAAPSARSPAAPPPPRCPSPGVLACLDPYMNIAMEQTEEYVNGNLKNKYGDSFIRGNNVVYITASK